jgi:hypothetical protein
MRTILVVVSGGVAEVVDKTVPTGVSVEIIDFDNLQDLSGPIVPTFSRAAQKYIKREDKHLAARLKSLRKTARHFSPR